jgi:sugar-specific transcriptional regulator TrmB
MTDNLILELTHIGFTEYEARVYLALLREHPATGYQISKQSGVPRSMAYESLARLASRGAVLKSSSGKTTTYRPLPPDVLLARLQDEHNVRVHKLSEGMERLYVARSQEALWSIDGRGAVMAYATNMIQLAESELMLVLPDRDMRDLEGVLRTAFARGVKVRLVLTGEAEPGFGEVVHHPPRESELQELTDSLLVIADRRETLIAGGVDALNATVTTNPNLVLIARQFIWMELFAQRIYARLGADLLERLESEDRQVLEGYSKFEGVEQT